jgi:7-carboxy-7-deazaguanine synthase
VTKLRLSEVYLSVQGEGPRVGLPTVFVRFAGCNLRCPGWPCDTPFAIYPEIFKRDAVLVQPTEVARRILTVAAPGTANICFTGGEPFLQPPHALRELVSELSGMGFSTFEVFTNGTVIYPEWALENFYFIMDWKLPGSGEDPNNGNRIRNLYNLTDGDAVKFVIKDEADFKCAMKLWEEHIVHQDRKAQYEPVEVYYGAVWGKIENKDLVAWALAHRLPWRLNIQTHNMIWPPNERAR